MCNVLSEACYVTGAILLRIEGIKLQRDIN